MGKTKRQYALYRRPTKNGRAIYYCRFRDGDDGLYLTAVSTGLAKRRDAEAWAIKQLKDHNVATRLSLTFAGFAEGWWDGHLLLRSIKTGSWLQLVARVSRRHAYVRQSPSDPSVRAPEVVVDHYAGGGRLTAAPVRNRSAATRPAHDQPHHPMPGDHAG